MKPSKPLRKLMIRVWSGPLPPWYNDWAAHVHRLKAFGWDFMVFHNVAAAAGRCYSKLGVDGVTLPPGTRKAGDLDPCLGVLFDDMIHSYDFWGHVGLDTVFGRLEHFLPDELLAELDVFGNDPNAICGPFSLYRNTRLVNTLFRRVGENGPVKDHIGREFRDWRAILRDPDITGWDEGAFSDVVVAAGHKGDIRFRSEFWQAHDKQPLHLPTPRLRIDDGRLLEAHASEIMMFHFNRKDVQRQWPVGLAS